MRAVKGRDLAGFLVGVSRRRDPHFDLCAVNETCTSVTDAAGSRALGAALAGNAVNSQAHGVRTVRRPKGPKRQETGAFRRLSRRASPRHRQRSRTLRAKAKAETLQFTALPLRGAGRGCRSGTRSTPPPTPATGFQPFGLEEGSPRHTARERCATLKHTALESRATWRALPPGERGHEGLALRLWSGRGLLAGDGDGDALLVFTGAGAFAQEGDGDEVLEQPGEGEQERRGGDPELPVVDWECGGEQRGRQKGGGEEGSMLRGIVDLCVVNETCASLTDAAGRRALLAPLAGCGGSLRRSFPGVSLEDSLHPPTPATGFQPFGLKKRGV